MTGAAFNVSVRKEARALLPLWGACMLALGALAPQLDNHLLLPFGVLIYGLGSIGLGAHSMGHEYAHRTVGQLLSQPVDRRALLLIKLAVLAVLLLTLAVAAFAGVVPALNRADERLLIANRTGVLIALAALCIAPAVTMLCRSGTAGMVFTLGIAGMVAVVSEFLGGPVGAMWFWYTMLMVSALAALVGWRHFTRLEAIEGGGRDLHLPGFGSARAAATVLGPPSRSPIARLIVKELRLQQMTFAVAALGVLTVAGFLLRAYFDPVFGTAAIVPITLVYAGALPLLIGALASAEERRMGTLEWQLLMPVSARLQFAVKAAVALVIALALAFALPVLVTGLMLGKVSHEWPALAAAVVLVTSASLYVSSLSNSSIRAVMMAMASIFVAFLAVQWAGMWMSIWLTRLFMGRPAWRPYLEWFLGGSGYELIILTAAGLAFSAPLLYFAHQNHRSAERPRTQIKRQAGWIAGAMAFGMFLLIVTGMG